MKSWRYLLFLCIVILGLLSCFELPVPISIWALIKESDAQWVRDLEPSDLLKSYWHALYVGYSSMMIDSIVYQPDIDTGC